MSSQSTNLKLIKPAGGENLSRSDYNDNLDTIDNALGSGFGLSTASSVNAEINALGDALAIIANGNTHAAITSGQFVYVRKHSTLADGLYVASSNISANATLSGSNLTADANGGLNALNSNIALNTGGGKWKDAPYGYTKSYKYESADVTEYDIPVSPVVVSVTKQNASRGVAICQAWNVDRIWINRLHDTWRGWQELALNAKLNPLLGGEVWTDFIAPTLTNGTHYNTGCRYRRFGCFVHILISVSFDSAPTNTEIFTLPTGYRPITITPILVDGGGSYNAKAQCTVSDNGIVRVTSVDKWVIGGGLFVAIGYL